MRKVLSVLLACGLVLLCACGKQTQDTDKPQDTLTGNYKAAVAAIDSGDYRTAYDLLKDQGDEQSKELFSHFVFVPTTINTNTQSGTAAWDSSTTLTYNASGDVLKLTRIYQGEVAETIYTYDNGRISTDVTTSHGITRTTEYTYDSAGRLCREHFVMADSTSEISETLSTYTYDKMGNLIEEKHSSSNSEDAVHTYRYNDAGKETLKRTDYAPGIWYEDETVYYENGNVHKTIHRRWDNQEFTTEYDEQGRLWRCWVAKNGEDPTLDTENTYDAAGRLLQTYYPNVGTVQHRYNEQGWLTETLDGANRTVYTYDSNGNCLTETRTINTALQSEKRYTYDTQGRLSEYTITYAGGKSETTAYVYDEYGNTLTRTYTGFSVETGGDLAITENVEWTVFYYPDEIPEVVQSQLDGLATSLNAA